MRGSHKPNDSEMVADLRARLGFYAFRISTSLPTLKVNVYFTDRPAPTLIDVPPDSPSILEELNEKLKSLGYCLRDIRTVIVTHSHLDHCGSARTIADISGAEIWAAKGTGEWLTNYEEESHDEERFIAAALRRAGAPGELLDRSVKHFRFMRKFTRKATVSRFLASGERLQFPCCSLKIVPVPGHTPWCIMLHDEEKKIAFTGDFLLGAISPNPLIQRPRRSPPGYHSLRAFTASLERLRGMELSAAFPGHGELIKNPGERAEKLLEAIGERRRFILRTFGRYREQTAFDVVQRLFASLHEEQVFLAVSEAWAHLEVLVDEGVLKTMKGVPTRFART
jgi:glyoxylase-like metal-dependent hydrolase (beta-lactamase superfamily II)